MRMFRLIELFRPEAAPARDARAPSPATHDECEPLLLTDFVEPPQQTAPAAR